MQADNRRISVYRFPRRALTLCAQLCMGIPSGAWFPARSADALPATLYGHFTQAMYRNRPITHREYVFNHGQALACHLQLGQVHLWCLRHRI